MPADALFEAVRQADLDAVSTAIQHGADVNTRNDKGDTVLHVACDEGLAPVVEWLLDHGADLEATRSDGETALMLAAESNAVDAIALLIARGADIEAKDAHGCTALILAAEYEAWAAARTLLGFGADINAATSPDAVTTGRTALMWAACRGSLDGVRLLVQSGARIDAHDTHGLTAMHLAASEENNADVEHCLVSAGANLNEPGGAGITPLMWAAQFADETTVRALLECGADANARDTSGRTALDSAKARGHEGIVAELAAAGGHGPGDPEV